MHPVSILSYSLLSVVLNHNPALFFLSSFEQLAVGRFLAALFDAISPRWFWILMSTDVTTAEVDGTDVTTLIPFFSDMLGKLGALDVWIAKYGANEVANCAREVAGTILPWIHLRDPEFPFESLLDAWSDSEDEPT